jgi:hypothetical protein
MEQTKLFLDGTWVQNTENLERALAPCRKVEPGGYTIDGNTTWLSPKGHLHLTWYRDDDTGEFLGWRTKPHQSLRLAGREHVFRIRSDDGFHWETTGGPSFAEGAILDPDEENPDRRFKAVYHGVAVLDEKGEVEIAEDRYQDLAKAAQDGREVTMGMFSCVSADGLTWRDHRPIVLNTHIFREWLPGLDISRNTDLDPVRAERRWWMPGEPGWTGGDSFPCLIYLPDQKKYVTFYRTNVDQRTSLFPEPQRRERAVGRSECTEFGEWGEHEMVMRAPTAWHKHLGYGAQDFYQFHTWPCGGIYLALVSVFYWDEDRVHMELAWSPNTIHWERICPGQDLVPIGTPGSPDYGGLYGSMQPRQVSDEIRVYYGASAGLHNAESSGDATLGLALFKPDRFAGLAPKGNAPGSLTTEPFAPGGGEFFLNFDATNGRVIAELCNIDGRAMDGYSRNDATPMGGDEIRAALRWKGGKLPKAMQSKNVRLRLFLESGTAYALYCA